LTTGTTNTFVSTPPTVTVTVQFADPAFASQPFTVTELPDLTGLSSDGRGIVAFDAPITLTTATVTFTAGGDMFALQLGV
jgi:hypothetical protein